VGAQGWGVGLLDGIAAWAVPDQGAELGGTLAKMPSEHAVLPELHAQPEATRVVIARSLQRRTGRQTAVLTATPFRPDRAVPNGWSRNCDSGYRRLTPPSGAWPLVGKTAQLWPGCISRAGFSWLLTLVKEVLREAAGNGPVAAPSDGGVLLSAKIIPELARLPLSRAEDRSTSDMSRAGLLVVKQARRCFRNGARPSLP